MTLLEWTKDVFKNNEVELFEDEKTIIKNGMTICRNVKNIHDLSLGIVTANDASEWYRCCRLHCPVGTIIEDFDPAVWNDLFADVSSLVRNALVKTLLKERFAKSAKTLLELMERRDKSHFAKEDQKISAKVTSGDQQNLSLEFTVVS